MGTSLEGSGVRDLGSSEACYRDISSLRLVLLLKSDITCNPEFSTLKKQTEDLVMWSQSSGPSTISWNGIADSPFRWGVCLPVHPLHTLQPSHLLLVSLTE